MFKKFLLIASIVCINLVSAVCLAAPSGGSNPIADGSLVAIATEYDYVFDRALKSSDIKDGNIENSGAFYGKLIFKVTDFLNVYAKAGLADLRIKSKLSNGIDTKEDYTLGFYTGGGARLSYQFVPKVKFILDNQLNWFRSNLENYQYANLDSTTESGHTSVWEYQLSGILSYTIDYQSIINPAQGEWPKFTPYAGVKYAYLKTDSNASASGSGFSVSLPEMYKNEDKVGIVCGLDITFESLGGFAFNIEGRFLDETAVSFYLDYSF